MKFEQEKFNALINEISSLQSEIEADQSYLESTFDMVCFRAYQSKVKMMNILISHARSCEYENGSKIVA